ncbi:MAG: LuxR C-terminal-related transcriptional regulator [Novosphingobium sp.]|nr:LuxR C-terminal-related transcriptional regulator [Novosphingobium sp.]
MGAATSVILIDADSRRRASICHSLSGSDLHVEPLESVDELRGRWPSLAITLIHDEDDAFARCVQDMTTAGCWLPIVAFAEQPAPARIVEVILEGAVDYIAWPFDPTGLAATLRQAEARCTLIGGSRIRQAEARRRIERLTRREREVLTGVAGGLSNRRIGEKLAISPRTVEIHRANMLTKMGANHTSEAIRIAIEAALMD